jgi:hypothetical protein
MKVDFLMVSVDQEDAKGGKITKHRPKDGIPYVSGTIGHFAIMAEIGTSKFFRDMANHLWAMESDIPAPKGTKVDEVV